MTEEEKLMLRRDYYGSRANESKSPINKKEYEAREALLTAALRLRRLKVLIDVTQTE